MIRCGFIAIFLLIILSPVSGQVLDPEFAKYLYNKGDYHELVTLDRLDKSGLKRGRLDSINFFTGLAYYNLQELETSISRLKSINNESELFNPSLFFASWSQMYLAYPDRAEELINMISPSNDAEEELRKMFLVASALIGKNGDLSGSIIESLKDKRKTYQPQWQRMVTHNDRLQGFKPKSYAAAGVLSALVPGTGRIYAGQKGAGVSSFLTVAAMGAVFLENGIRTGWDSWNTITAASIFGIFYFGNIYGSIVGIKVYRERFFNELNRAVLLDINIPLRNIYLQ
jgi:hypothetical protein